MEYVPNRISLSSHLSDAAGPTHWKLEQDREVAVLVDVKIALLLRQVKIKVLRPMVSQPSVLELGVS
jgi:hypothetical protein